jgi:hypothetical protein
MKLFNPVESMLNRFTGGGGSSKLPPPPAPSPTPEDIDLQAIQKGDAERRRIKGQKGRRSTILTEGVNQNNQQKASILGDTI